MKRIAIALGLVLAGGSVFAIDEYIAFATLQVRIVDSACTHRINGGPEQTITDRRVIVTPRFRRKAKSVPRPSKIPDPEVDVDI